MSAAAAPPARRRRPHAANRKGREITRECGFWAALRPPALLPCRGMRTAIALALLLAACKSAPAPERHLNEQAALHPRSRYGEDRAYVQALREELEAMRRIQAVLGWYAGTQGETSLQKLTYVGHDRLFQKAALDAIAVAEQQAGVTPSDALALRFVRRALAGEIVTLPWKDKPVAYRDLQNLIAQEEDPDRRRQAFAAMNAVRVQKLNPILQRKEQAAQKAARETGFTDYVALSEDLRSVKLDPLLLAGVAYVKATDAVFRATLDRIAREELDTPREKLRVADLNRLWKAPRLSRFFDRELELRALQAFLGGIGLDLRTAAGTDVRVDDSLHPKKRPRVIVRPVNAPLFPYTSVYPALRRAGAGAHGAPGVPGRHRARPAHCRRHRRARGRQPAPEKAPAGFRRAGQCSGGRAHVGEAGGRPGRLRDPLPRSGPCRSLRQRDRPAQGAGHARAQRAYRGVRRILPARLLRPALASALPRFPPGPGPAGAGQPGAGRDPARSCPARDDVPAPVRLRQDRLRAAAARASSGADRARARLAARSGPGERRPPRALPPALLGRLRLRAEPGRGAGVSHRRGRDVLLRRLRARVRARRNDAREHPQALRRGLVRKFRGRQVPQGAALRAGDRAGVRGRGRTVGLPPRGRLRGRRSPRPAARRRSGRAGKGEVVSGGVPALFATFLLLSLALAGTVAFSSGKARGWLKWLLLLSLLVAWVALGFAVKDIVLRTSATLVTPRGVRQPRLIEQAAREGVTLFLALGGPALLATVLGWLAVKATRRRPE